METNFLNFMHNFSDKISVHFAMFKIKVGLSFKNLQIDILVIEKKLPHSACMDHAPFRHDETKQKKNLLVVTHLAKIKPIYQKN